MRSRLASAGVKNAVNALKPRSKKSRRQVKKGFVGAHLLVEKDDVVICYIVSLVFDGYYICL